MQIAYETEGEMNLQINEKAPVVSSQKNAISAPVYLVWEVLTGIENWPAWQKNVSRAKLQGKLNEGTLFKWKAGGIAFKSQIHTKRENTFFGWTGKTVGVDAIHNWFFEKAGNTTTVKAEESLRGILQLLFPGYFRKTLEAGMKEQLREPKTASESEYKQQHFAEND